MLHDVTREADIMRDCSELVWIRCLLHRQYLLKTIPAEPALDYFAPSRQLAIAREWPSSKSAAHMLSSDFTSVQSRNKSSSLREIRPWSSLARKTASSCSRSASSTLP